VSMSGKAHQTRAELAARQLRDIDDDVRCNLAVLKAAERRTIEKVLATFNLGDRHLLTAMGVTTDTRNSVIGPVEVSLTPAGMQIIEACYELGLPADAGERLQAFRERIRSTNRT
jgi:hypothetical protein